MYSKNYHRSLKEIPYFILLVSLFCAHSLFAQDPDSLLYAQWMDEEVYIEEVGCKQPVIKDFVPVLFDNSMTITFKLNQFGYSDQIEFVVGDESTWISTLNGNSFVFQDIPLYQQVQIMGKNSCDEEVIIFSYSTDPKVVNYNGDLIMVGLKVSQMINAFSLQNDDFSKVPLRAFMNMPEYDHISTLEKMHVYQALVLKGQPFPNDFDFIIGNIPPERIPPVFDCSCAVIAMENNAKPYGGIYFSPGGDKKRYDSEYNYHRNNCGSGGKIEVNEWDKGAAKVENQKSSGWKERCYRTCKQFFNGNTFGDTAAVQFENYFHSSFNFVCLDGDELPTECDCDKKIDFSYYYGTELITKANVPSNGGGTCGNQKRSEAYARDMGIVYCVEAVNGKLQQPVIFDALSLGTFSTCNIGADTTILLQSIEDMLRVIADSIQFGDVIRVFGQDNVDIDDLANLVNFNLGDYYDAAFDVLRAIFRYNDRSCSNSIQDGAMEGRIIQNLYPNRPLSFYLKSGASLYTAGRKSWYAEADVRSAGYIVATLLPGVEDNEESFACCSNYGATFNGGALDRPIHSGNLWGSMGSALGSNQMSECMIWGGLSAGDVGWCTREKDAGAPCENYPIGSDPRNEDIPQALQDNIVLSDLSIFTTNGILMHHESPILTFKKDGELNRYLGSLRYKLGLSPGVYIMSLILNGEVQSDKIVIH